MSLPKDTITCQITNVTANRKTKSISYLQNCTCAFKLPRFADVAVFAILSILVPVNHWRSFIIWMLGNKHIWNSQSFWINLHNCVKICIDGTNAMVGENAFTSIQAPICTRGHWIPYHHALAKQKCQLQLRMFLMKQYRY